MKRPGATASAMPKVIVIVPALNEEDAIGAVVRAVKQVLPDTPVLVIDDHSADCTARVAEEAGADVVRLPAHLGVGGCVRTGYQIAFELGYEWVIRIDGDGQHEARDIPRILDSLVSTGADLVIGSALHCARRVAVAVCPFRWDRPVPASPRAAAGQDHIRSHIGFCRN